MTNTFALPHRLPIEALRRFSLLVHHETVPRWHRTLLTHHPAHRVLHPQERRNRPGCKRTSTT